ncbi:MAG TPA: histidine kinase [Chitinophagaceae bacterium]|nr:histidine kinase [Chitinophagaceae bacterium]
MPVRSKIYFSGCLIFAVLLSPRIGAQSNAPYVHFPPVYYKLTSDTARMHFLMNAIGDSLNTGQLNAVYDMAREGMTLAEKNEADTMKGIFYFDMGKAFSYQFAKPDSAIYYYKKVPPFFPDKMNYYNIISVREIMERYAQAGNKDSAMAYLDALHDRLDTLSVTNKIRVGLSQNMAGVYQYYGMFKTAIELYKISIEGNRKNNYGLGIGLGLANLAELYDESEDDTNAVKYAREALKYLEGNNLPYLGTVANLATYYTNLNRNDSAIYFNNLADSVGRLINSDAQIHIRGPFNYVNILCNQKKYNEARWVLAGIRPWLIINSDREGMVDYLLSSAVIDTALHRWESAADSLLRALALAKEDGREVSIVQALQGLAAVNAKLNNFKEAYKYQQEYMLHKDSLTNDETKSRLADFEAMYKTRQKEEQIALLQKEDDIKNLQLKNSRQTNALYLCGFIFLLSVAGIFFYQRNRRLKIEAEKVKAELQMQILRSQMNPHFIFNCLNSIEYFIMQSDKRQASDYLNKFSILIRNILDSSRNDRVPLMKDMETLNLYVELEQLRFNNKFNFKSYIDPALRGGDYRVPPLLIQPFVENAIVHGLANSDEDQLHLTVTASLHDNMIKYVIQDNGIGRERAGIYNMQNRPYHKSVGLKITEDRINRYNRAAQATESIAITDLYDEDRNPEGTRVEILLKAI